MLYQSVLGWLLRLTVALTLLIGQTTPSWAEVVVTDDLGRQVRLPKPATRIVSLAPHITENLFAAGVGDRVVGVVAYSDYPPEAATRPQVGGYSQLNVEAVLALQPDLVVAWASGNPPAALEQLAAIGVPLYYSQPRTVEDIARTLVAFGQLGGAPEVGEAAAAAFRQRVEELRRTYANRPRVSLFYQIWDQPLRTVGGQQIISDVMALCGGRNVFAALPGLAPVVSVEAVLAANPEAIVASGMGEARPDWLDKWRRWPQLAAVAGGHLFFIPPQLLQRPTPRLLQGAEQLCQALEMVRQARQKRSIDGQ